jgi:hypothetical protein
MQEGRFSRTRWADDGSNLTGFELRSDAGQSIEPVARRVAEGDPKLEDKKPYLSVMRVHAPTL